MTDLDTKSLDSALENFQVELLDDSHNYLVLAGFEAPSDLNRKVHLRVIPSVLLVHNSDQFDRLVDLEPTLIEVIANQELPTTSFGEDRAIAKTLDDTLRRIGFLRNDDEPSIFYFQQIGEPDTRATVFALARRRASGDLLPYDLRRLAGILSLHLESGFMDSLEFIQESARAGLLRDSLKEALRVCNAAGGIVWRYEFGDQEYRPVEQVGPIGHGYLIPLGGVRYKSSNEGLVGQIRPEQSLIIYDLFDKSRRLPQLENWVPHDKAVFDNNGWRACVGWPVVYAGELLGAITIYGPNLDELNYERHIRTQIARAFAPALQQADHDARISALEEAYDTALTRSASGEIAVELIHDFTEGYDLILTAMQTCRPKDAGEARVVQQATTQIAFLRDLTGNLTRLAKGKHSHESTTNVAAVLNEYTPMLEGLIKVEGSNAKLFVETPVSELSRQQSVTIAMNEFDVLRMVVNLIRNAAIWTRHIEQPTITARVFAADISSSAQRPNQNVVIEVVDNGPGISSDNLVQVFDRGFSTRKEEGGSGLGLHIVRKLALNAQGRARAFSRPKLYTVFRIEIPGIFR